MYQTQKNVKIEFQKDDKNVKYPSNIGEKSFTKIFPLEYNIEVVKTITNILTSYLGMNITFEMDQDPLILQPKNKILNKIKQLKIKSQENNSNFRVIFEVKKEERLVKKSMRNSGKKNSTMGATPQDLDNLFQEQVKDRIHHQTSEENIKKLSYFESNESNEEKDIESDSETDGVISIINDSFPPNSIGSIREFSINTKENRDSLQDQSKIGENSQTSSLKSSLNKSKSKQKLKDYVKYAHMKIPVTSKETIQVEAKPSHMKYVNNYNFISASNNINFINHEGKFIPQLKNLE